MGSTSRWVACLRSHFPLNHNGKRVELFSLKQKQSDALNQSSIRVSGVSMNKIQCSKRESLSSHPKPKFLPSATLYVLIYCWCLVFFFNPPKKCKISHSETSFLLHSPRLRWGSGQGHWEQSETRPVKKHNDDIDNFVLEKKTDGFLCGVWSPETGYFGPGPKNLRSVYTFCSTFW